MPKFPKLKILIFSFGLGLFFAVTLFPNEQPKTQDVDVSVNAAVYSLESGSKVTCEDGLCLAASESEFEKQDALKGDYDE